MTNKALITIFLISCDQHRLDNCKVYHELKDTFNIEVYHAEKQENRVKGCYDAHYQVAQIANQRKLKYYMCFEDHIAYNIFNLEKFIETIKTVLNSKLELVYFARVPKFWYTNCKRYKENIYSSIPAIQGTTAYIIKRKSYLEFLQNPYSKINKPVDFYFTENLVSYKNHFIHPTPFRRNNITPSIIEEGKIINVLRKLYFHQIFYNTLDSIEVNYAQILSLIVIVIILMILIIFII